MERRGGLTRLWIIAPVLAGILSVGAWVLLRSAPRRPGGDPAASSRSRAVAGRQVAPPPIRETAATTSGGATKEGNGQQAAAPPLPVGVAPAGRPPAEPGNQAPSSTAGTTSRVDGRQSSETHQRPVAEASETPAPGSTAAREAGRRDAGQRRQPRQPPAAAPESEAAPAGEPIAGLLVPGPGCEAAEPLEIADAIYPEAARGSGRQPHVLVAVLIDEHGSVVAARVKSGDSSRLGFNEAAQEAARRSRFLPARKDGVRGKAWSELMIEFVSPPPRN
jgi:TonB family protein